MKTNLATNIETGDYCYNCLFYMKTIGSCLNKTLGNKRERLRSTKALRLKCLFNDRKSLYANTSTKNNPKP